MPEGAADTKLSVRGPSSGAESKGVWEGSNAVSAGTTLSPNWQAGSRATGDPNSEAPRFSPKPAAPAPAPGPASPPVAERPRTDNLVIPSSGRDVIPEPARPTRGVRPEFAEMMDSARRELQSGETQYARVLLFLSRFYGNPEFTDEEDRQLGQLLDQLAEPVIYSRDFHLIEPPYTVQPGDTWEKIGQRYSIPWQLLAKINRIRDASRLQPGMKLKVLPGPFEAKVLVRRYEMVMYVAGHYAGRFEIGTGRDLAATEGSFTVQEKKTGMPYNGPDGVIAAGDPRNPLGRLWIGLGPIGIHGTDDRAHLRQKDGRGYICMGDRDIEDVYDILSQGSRVTIVR